MSKRSLSILFMDDELSDNAPAHLADAVKELRTLGHEVTEAMTLQDALDRFQSSIYDLFIMDLDMHKVIAADAFQKKEDGTQLHARDAYRGSDLAQVYKSLDNGCVIVVYSGAGTSQDLLTLANYHAFGYVAKGDRGVDNLLKMVKQARDAVSHDLRLPSPREGGKILVVETKGTPYDRAQWKSIVGDLADIEFVSIQDAPERMSTENYNAVVVAEKQFTAHHVPYLQKLAAFQPRPHLVLASDIAEGESAKGVLIDLVNLRPFKLVNLGSVNAQEVLSASLQQAFHWYDGWETFEASIKYIYEAEKYVDYTALAEEYERCALMDDEGDDEILEVEESES